MLPKKNSAIEIEIRLKGFLPCGRCQSLRVHLGREDFYIRRALLLNSLHHDEYDIIAAHRQRKLIGASLPNPDDTIDFREVACQQLELIELCWRQLSRRANLNVGRIRVIGAKAGAMNLQSVAARFEMSDTEVDWRRRRGWNDVAVKWSIADLLLGLLKAPR